MSTAGPLPRGVAMMACERPVKDSIRIWMVLLLLLVDRDVAVAMKTLKVALQSKSPCGFSRRLNAEHRDLLSVPLYGHHYSARIQ